MDAGSGASAVLLTCKKIFWAFATQDLLNRGTSLRVLYLMAVLDLVNAHARLAE